MKCPTCNQELEHNPHGFTEGERWERGVWDTFDWYCRRCHLFANCDDKGPLTWGTFHNGGGAIGMRHTDVPT